MVNNDVESVVSCTHIISIHHVDNQDNHVFLTMTCFTPVLFAFYRISVFHILYIIIFFLLLLVLKLGILFTTLV